MKKFNVFTEIFQKSLFMPIALEAMTHLVTNCVEVNYVTDPLGRVATLQTR